MKYLFKYITLAALLSSVFIIRLSSQERTVIAGLESDSLYMALIEQEGVLKLQEDSLNARIADTRSLFRSDHDNRQRYSEDILTLEGKIFDIRNLIGITAGKINSIEQEFIIKNLSEGGDPRQTQAEGGNGSPETSAVITNNPFFAENLQPEDYAILREAQSKEREVADAIGMFADNYALISRIAEELPGAEDKETADSLFSRYETLNSVNENYSQFVGEQFGYIYENKLYCYNYILDKLGRRSQLSSFENKISEARDRAIAVGQDAQSPEIAAYKHRKALLFEYEKTLARMAHYDRSLDSLTKAENVFARTDFSFPLLDVEEKLFLDFSPVEFHSPAKYNSRNPVPELTVHPKGEIYRILLGSFQREQQVSILKGAYPVGVLKQDGRFEYFAGGFATVEEAAAAADQLKAKGFKEPKVAQWVNGKYKLFTQGEVDRLLGRVDTGLFRLSIDTAGKPLPGVVREILEDYDNGAEISRSGELYIIGTFDTRDEAREVMEEILDETDGLDIKIEDVG